MAGSDKIENLIKLIARLPGLGKRSAQRIALHLIKNKTSLLPALIQSLEDVKENVKICPVCGNFDTIAPCAICQSPKRDKSIICVISDVSSLWAMERTGYYNGMYHITGGILSSVEGIEPENLNIHPLINRASDDEVKEVIIALPATVDGKITEHYIAEKLSECDVKISELAQGVPVGGELDYLDDGTIAEALKSRKSI